MSDVFVSYKAEDRERVRPLVAALEASGLDVWWDAHLGGGATWRDAIAEELDRARCVVVVWSKRSTGPDGRFVRDEATRALRRSCYLPVAIDKVDPPLGFGESQMLALNGWKGDPADPRCQAIVDAVHGRLGRSRAIASPQRGRRGVDRRALLAGGAVLVLGTAGLGGWRLLRPRSDNQAIAVLPFANLSGDPRQAYFSDGIAEELRSALSRIAGLKVVARTSSEAVGGEDAKSAAARLGVANILTGSVRRSPQMIRISAQLVDGRHGVERWSASYDRPVGDTLQIQTDIAGQVADALSIRLGTVDRQRLVEGGTRSPEAQDLLLKAMVVDPNDATTASLDRSIGLADAALALDPNYGNAMAMKAELQAAIAGSHSPTAARSQANYRTAEATARRAIQLAPQSRLGYSALANVLDQQLKRRAALAAYQRMLQLPGNEGRTLGNYAIFLSETGRADDALAVADRALEVDPLNALVHGLRMMVLFNARRYPETVDAAQQMLKLRPGAAWPRAIIASCHFMLGDAARAVTEFAAMGGAENIAPPWVAAVAIRLGDQQKADRIMAAMRAEASDAAHFQYAEVYAQEGKIAQAVDALYSAYQARDPGLTMINVDQLLDPLRGDARFKALVAKLDFPT